MLKDKKDLKDVGFNKFEQVFLLTLIFLLCQDALSLFMEVKLEITQKIS